METRPLNIFTLEFWGLKSIQMSWSPFIRAGKGGELVETRPHNLFTLEFWGLKSIQLSDFGWFLFMPPRKKQAEIDSNVVVNVYQGGEGGVQMETRPVYHFILESWKLKSIQMSVFGWFLFTPHQKTSWNRFKYRGERLSGERRGEYRWKHDLLTS